MALIEIYHVVADMYDVDPDFTTDLVEGMCVRLAADGTVAPANTSNPVFGIAGDTQSDTQAGTPYAADLTIGADGAAQRSTQNRVSDFYNETLASGKMTVYTGGGKFATDQYDTTDSYTPGAALFTDDDGQLTVDGTGTDDFNIIGRVAAAPAAYPSGVPGTDTTDGSLSLGTFLTFILVNS
jgi:hypothetical protein